MNRQQRRLQRKLADQIRLEQNGAPIPGEIATRMTQQTDIQPLFQVKADVKEDGRVAVLPVGPKIGLEACEQILIAVNGQISLGHLPGWGNARMEPVHNF